MYWDSFRFMARDLGVRYMMAPSRTRSELGSTALGDALVFAPWNPNPYEIPVSPNQSAPREPHEGSLAISWGRTQHGID